MKECPDVLRKCIPMEFTWQLPMAVERIKKNTRVYAKKQMTWFQRDTGIHWLDLDNVTTDEAVQHVLQFL